MSSSETELHHRFLRLFTTHEEAVRAFVRRLVPTRADADDVMQEVSIVLWEKFTAFREGEDFKAWAFGVARFEVLAWLRDKGRDRLVLDEEVVLKIAHEAAAHEPVLSRQREALERCMEKVPQEQEVAQSSGRSVTGFYQWLHRIRKMLHDCIQNTLAREVSS
jgi:RNA polymerase sigma-70 factor (ECF subfamily)